MVRAAFWKRRRPAEPLRPRLPLKVLIVDDEVAICKFVDRTLRDADVETKVAFNASTALAMIETFGPFDLLLTDVNMPNVLGHELASEARRLDPDIKVLYLTGYGDQLFEARQTLWDGEAYLDKPTSGAALLEAIANLVNSGDSDDRGPEDPDRRR